jgi:hypothetical protein
MRVVDKISMNSHVLLESIFLDVVKQLLKAKGLIINISFD